MNSFLEFSKWAWWPDNDSSCNWKILVTSQLTLSTWYMSKTWKKVGQFFFFSVTQPFSISFLFFSFLCVLVFLSVCACSHIHVCFHEGLKGKKKNQDGKTLEKYPVHAGQAEWRHVQQKCQLYPHFQDSNVLSSFQDEFYSLFSFTTLEKQNVIFLWEGKVI